jgi:hypothetical protein
LVPYKTSAEAIVERGAFSLQNAFLVTPLANFGQITFSQASAGTNQQTSSSMAILPNLVASTMVDVPIKKQLASPSPITPGGGFSVTWLVYVKGPPKIPPGQ